MPDLNQFGLPVKYALIGAVTPDETGRAVQMGPGTYALVVPASREGRPIRVEQLY